MRRSRWKVADGKTMLSWISSIGYVLVIMTFIAGFRMVKRSGLVAEWRMHRINGYLTIAVYTVLAVMAIASGTEPLYIVAWGVGMAIHLLKLLIVKKGLAVRYGGYFGGLLLITWLVVIFTHLPR